jgi:hypothetical protein
MRRDYGVRVLDAVLAVGSGTSVPSNDVRLPLSKRTGGIRDRRVHDQ